MEKSALTPGSELHELVTTQLTQCGRCLFGRGLFVARFSVYFNHGRWILKDSPAGFLSRNRKPSSLKLAVQLVEEGSRFKIHWEKWHSPFSPASVLTDSTEVNDLNDGLEKVTGVLIAARKNSNPLLRSLFNPGAGS